MQKQNVHNQYKLFKTKMCIGLTSVLVVIKNVRNFNHCHRKVVIHVSAITFIFVFNIA